MRQPFVTFIAKRFIKSKTGNGFLSFMTWISITGLVIGVTALILVTSVMNGFEQVLTERILGMVPHSTINNTNGIDNWQDYADKIKANDEVVGVAPFVNTRGMSSINGEVHGTIINGIDYRYQGDVSILPKVMVQGRLDSLLPNQYNIILGENLVKERGLQLGDNVSIMLVQPNDTEIGVTPKFHIFTLSGVFSISEEVDSWMSYINIEDAAALTESINKPKGLRLKLKDIMQAEASAQKAKKVLKVAGIEVTTSTWEATHHNLYDSIKKQKRMLVLLLFLIIVVAIFNIMSALVMMTTEKRAEIAILKTFGASNITITKIFIVQGLLIGAMGTMIGLLLGVSLTLTIGATSNWLNTTFGLGLFDNYYVTQLPAKIDAIEVAIIIVVSLVVCTIASIYPAIKAANSPPVEGLKYE